MPETATATQSAPQPKPRSATPAEAAALAAKSAAHNDAHGADFAQMLEESIGRFKAGEVISGEVLAIRDDRVHIDVGFKSEGQVDAWEFMEENGTMKIGIGSRVDVYVEEVEDEHGDLVLSKEKADRLKIWDALSDTFDAERSLKGRILSRVKGGLSVDLQGVKAFLPGSQVDIRPVRNVDALLGEFMEFRIIKFNKRRGNIVLSRRVLLEDELEKIRESTLGALQEGSIVDGRIKNLTEYGAFIDLGGIDGLLHLTDMSWGRVQHPTELFQVGDELKVKVLKFDNESERVSLGLKQIQPDPWVDAALRYPEGKRVKGRVVSLTEYGAFIEVEPGVEGLVHITEMSWTKRVRHPSKVVMYGQEVEAQVLSVSEGNRKLSLGMKQVTENPWNAIDEKFPVGARVTGTVRNITNFGLFIALDEGVDGLVHVSDISWTENIRHPGEIYNRNDKLEALVLKIDRENEKLSLGIKQLQKNPWEGIQKRFPLGGEVTGGVTSVTEFGVYVKLAEGIDGLIYNSELADEPVKNTAEAFPKGKEVRAVVTKVDAEDQKIGLSIRALNDKAQREELKRMQEETGGSQATTFGELLKQKQAAQAESKAAAEAEEEVEYEFEEYEVDESGAEIPAAADTAAADDAAAEPATAEAVAEPATAEADEDAAADSTSASDAASDSDESKEA